MLSAAERRAKTAAVIRVSSGNFIEMYDFMIFGYYAKYIGETFFPVADPFASLMLSLATFGVGYLMRPLGAIVLGAYIDKHGRRQGLLVTLGLMAIGSATIALTPSYASIGIAAPLIVVAGRLIQGLSAGVELGGVSVYLAEIATPGNRGFYTSWQSASQQVAVMASALISLVLLMTVSPADMSAWGWRIPLILGCLIIPLVFVLRRSLQETEVFAKKRTHHSVGQIFAIVAKNWPVVIIGMMMSVFTTTAFYLITAYTPTFGREALKMSAQDAMLVTLFVGASNFIWLPVGGWLSDRFGRRKLLYGIPLLAILTVYPIMDWLVEGPTFAKLLTAELSISVMFGLYNGAMVPRLTEIVDPHVRTAAFALAFSLATAIFGGFTPAVATYLIQATGNKAAPALWLSLAAAISLVGAFLSRNLGVGIHDDFEVEPAAAI